MSPEPSSFDNATHPLTSFKYRTGASALKCLTDGVIYFASPEELNDTLEAKFDLSSAKQSWEMEIAAINEIATNRLSAERIDPSLLPPEAYVAAHTTENARFYGACQGVGIYSTSARPDNQAMWAYYCDSSKGVCLELVWSASLMESEQLYPADVNYTDQSRQIDRSEDTCLLLRKLAAENPYWSVDQLLVSSMTERHRRHLGIWSIARATSMKHSHWRHESEIRILSPKPGPRPLLKAVLKRVYFARTDFPEWGPIMNTLHRHYPDVELARISFHHAAPLTRVEEHEFRIVELPETR